MRQFEIWTDDISDQIFPLLEYGNRNLDYTCCTSMVDLLNNAWPCHLPRHHYRHWTNNAPHVQPTHVAMKTPLNASVTLGKLWLRTSVKTQKVAVVSCASPIHIVLSMTTVICIQPHIHASVTRATNCLMGGARILMSVRLAPMTALYTASVLTRLAPITVAAKRTMYLVPKRARVNSPFTNIV